MKDEYCLGLAKVESMEFVRQLVNTLEEALEGIYMGFYNS